MKNLFNYLITLLIGFIIGLLYCDIYIHKECPYNEEVIISSIDTVFIEKGNKIIGKKPKYSILVKKDNLPKEVKEIISDTTIYKTPIVRTFITHFKDSIIDGKLTSYVVGELISSDFDYTFKQLEINRKDSIIRYTERNKLLVGVEINIGSPIKHISPTIEFYHKSKWALQYRFEFNPILGNSHNIGVKKVISFKNNKKH